MLLNPPDVTKRIISLGFDFPHENVENLAFVSDRSLLDADIVVIQPSLSSEYGLSGQFFAGQPVLQDTPSFRVREAAAHWRSELVAALADGKTIVVFLCKPSLVQLYTGQRTTSGTGRNQKVTNLVEPFTSYSALPVKFTEVVARSGSDIRVAANLGPLRAYWEEFGDLSPYQVYFTLDGIEVMLTTRTGKRSIGGLARVGTGTVILLPPPEFEWDEMYEETDDDEDDDFKLSERGRAIGSRLVELLVDLDAALRVKAEGRPLPRWAQHEDFRSPAEESLIESIAAINSEMDALATKRDATERALEEEGALKRLLYETGKPLESAVTAALQVLGFDAHGFSESDSEFDVVFESAEGRFLGEIEGKDNKAINIDKLSQLERNLQEDFAREEIKDYATGVLFGNAFLSSPPAERPVEYFTQKCLSGAARGGIALVRTPDLFDAVLAVKRGADDQYRQLCREAFAAGKGNIVQFPKP